MSKKKINIDDATTIYKDKFGKISALEDDPQWRTVQTFFTGVLDNRLHKYYNSEHKLLKSWQKHYALREKPTRIVRSVREGRNYTDLQVFQRHWLSLRK